MPIGDATYLQNLYNLKYLFNDKWAPAIIVALAQGPRRRVDILSTVNSYSIGEEWSDKNGPLHDSILARTLRKMTAEGLLARNRNAETFPPKVFYSVTPEILEFLELADPVIAWAGRHPELMAQAQAYSRRHGAELDTLTAGPEPDVLDDHEDDEYPDGDDDRDTTR